ncbi:MAG: MFS family permease [Loktanella salsilacus]|jgi:MFS family permease|uniref:MFS transporter n=1 Tax=Loktanella salsilacus TaxID=195913 RepID=UPI0020B6F2F4|nr:MFS transporter [Loktanella salsilacus]MBU0780366.1 MFS transporter [Alphaproteobacteria bacterium]MBU1836894.1 MFS transporter [Alphaproteobacteria bacterium]UTH49457.1 MFS transporter [Loktanella salsilacus]
MIDDSRAKRNVAVLVAAQALLGAQMPMIFVIGGLAGGMLSPNICLATLPITFIVFSSMTTAPWLSPLMQRRGRRFGFVLGAAAGALGALIAAYGLYVGSFAILLLGSFFTGIYMSAQGFYRFAAADTASDSFKPKAISYVLAGGLISALIGPQLNKLVQDALVVPFLGTYLAVAGINLVGMSLFFFLDLPKGTRGQPQVLHAIPPRTRGQLLRDPRIVVAIVCGMVSYALMNLVMTSTPLAVVGCGFTKNNANDIVSAHVIAMYLPSFFTGHLIARFGVTKIVGAGLVILGLAGMVALSGVTLGNFFGALVLLGIGWNFGFIGATTMLAGSHNTAERGVVQGLNDTIVFGMVTVASLASGGLMNCAGGSAVQGWNMVNMAMIPLLVLAGGALIWLIFSARRPLA